MNDPVSPPTEADPQLAEYLRDRDIVCPSCGALLRGHAAAACPGCGVALSVPILQAAPPQGAPRAIIIVRVLSAIAFCVAAYLASTALLNSQPAGCSGEGGCNEVLSSRWSKLWGVPVSVPGMIVYIGIFTCTFYVTPGSTDRQRRDAWTVLIVLAVFAALAAIWFIYLQLVQIGAICHFCMTDHICGLIIAALILASAPITRGERLPQGQRSTLKLGGPRSAMLLTTAACVMGLFMLAQLAFESPTHQVTGDLHLGDAGNTLDLTAAPNPKNGANGANDGGDVAVPTTPSGKPIDEKTFVPLRLPNTPKQATLLFARDAVPMRGPVDAPFVFVCLIDYTCPHCRAFHNLIDESIQRYGKQVAFMILPMPLNSDCNQFVYHTDERHKPACELAWLSLAVWKADAGKFAQFDDWLFAPQQPRTAEEARAHAQMLVGKEALAAALESGWPQKQTQRHVKVYGFAGQGQVPKVMFRARVISGAASKEAFWKILEDLEKLGLKPAKE